jgi:hypothetical protein
MSQNESQTTQLKTQEELFKYPIFKTIKELLQEIENLEVKKLINK